MKKRFMITVVSALALVAAFATTAQAYPTKTSACTGCHTQSAVVGVTAVETANDGVKATYTVTVTGPDAILGWTVLSGSTNLANATAGTGTFQVAVGKTYTVWGVSKSATAMPYSNSISISPAAPLVPGTPVPTTTPEPTVTPGPTAPPVVAAKVTLKMKFKHLKKTVVKLKNAHTGKVLVGKVASTYKKATFKNVPDGTYVLRVKYLHHKTKVVGKYTVTSGKIAKVVAP